MIKDIHAELRERGWFHMPSAGAKQFHALAASFGEVVHKTDVRVKPESRGLVTSAQELDFHTDHSKVDYVAWLCVNPANEGGETILADARKALSLLSSNDQKILETITLEEHCMFRDDLRQAPLLSNINGKPKFYYSHWLVDENMSDQQRYVFNAFRRAVATIPFDEFKLHHDDILVVDNSRILHGRRAIKDPSRELKRLWIKSTSNTIGENYANAN